MVARQVGKVTSYWNPCIGGSSNYLTALQLDGG
jgi:hypothetical protein